MVAIIQAVSPNETRFMTFILLLQPSVKPLVYTQWTVLHQFKIPDCDRYRNVVFFGYMSCGYRFSKAVDHVQDLTLRWPVVSWQKAIEFMKSLSALCTYISALSQVEIYLLPESRTVFNDLFSVVMNAVCSVSAAGAFMRMPGQLYFYMNWFSGFFHIFYDYIF